MKPTSHAWLQRAASAIVCVATVLGCSRRTPIYTQWATRAQRIAPASDPVFSAYAQAAVNAEVAAQKFEDRVVFTPGQRDEIQRALAPCTDQIRAQTGKSVAFDFQPRGPFDPAPYAKGWRLIGRSMVWDIQESGADYDKAIGETVQATSFGFGLTSGSAVDASLGLSIADDARKAMVLKLDKLSPAQLTMLAQGIEADLAMKPTLEATIEHERQDMLLAVQTVQDAYSKDDYHDLRINLGPDCNDAITYLKDMHSDDSRRRPAYFEKFAAEANAEADWLAKACLQPAVKRVPPEIKSSDPRPWRKFSKAFFSGCRPLLAMNDATLARTRLLALTCRILAQIKSTGSAPPDLGIYSARLRQDPYSGYPFVYHADGADYYLYSVGPDFKDDGGQTDETFTSPDLTLEKP